MPIVEALTWLNITLGELGKFWKKGPFENCDFASVRVNLLIRYLGSVEARGKAKRRD